MKHYVKHSFGTGIEKFLKIFLLWVQKRETAINHSPTLLSRGKHPLWGVCFTFQPTARFAGT